jgi:UDP-glucuronate 4-epimerase
VTETVLVTGGAGFIGSHLCERLAKRGERVIIVDNFDSYYGRDAKQANVDRAMVLGDVGLAEVDVRDEAALRAVFAAVRPDAVVHLAARPGVRPSFEAPHLYFDINVNGTLTLLQACREYAVGRVLFASSSSVYGNSHEAAHEEHTPCRPISPYGASKAAGEALCSSHASSTGASVTALRFFTVYGPRQRPDMAIARFSRMIAAGEEIPVYGDGSSRRDYTYITDIVSGILAALDAQLPGYNVLNLGRGQPFMLRDLLRLLELSLEKRARMLFLPSQPGDPDSTCADISTAAQLIGYEAKIAAQNGIVRYAEWFLESQRELVGSR